MSISILVADSLHINKKNFASFFKFVEQTKPNITFENKHKDWWSLYGNYDSKLHILNEKIDILSKLSSEALFDYKICDISLFHVCRAELLSLVSVQEIWFDDNYPNTLSDIFNKLFKYNRALLLQNMAAAWYWLAFWNQKIIDSPQYDFCCIFSGSLIYQRALIEILKFKPTKVMIMESLFTGNEYYCEERYSPIANRSDVMHKAVYNKWMRQLENVNHPYNERIKAINKMLLMKNKNVVQPVGCEPFVFSTNAPVVTIIGQVVNDFSLLEINGLGISSIKIYKELISALTQVGFNVVLKTHPWENEKNNIKIHLTKNIMENFVNNLPSEQKKLVHIVDNYSIKELFHQSNHIISLCSQGLIEAAFEGFKTIQLGNAFFGKKGFTYDYSINQIAKLVEDLKNNNLKQLLSLSEYEKVEEFLTVLLQKHTISVFDSGVPVLKERFKKLSVVSLVEPKVTKNLVSTEKKLPAHVVKESNDTQKIETIIQPIVGTESAKKIINNDIVFETSTQRKWKKFQRNPRLFFAQSKYSLLRPLKYFFPKEKI